MSFFLLWLSLALLRFDIFRATDLGFFQAIHLGLLYGFYYDLVFAILPFILGFLFKRKAPFATLASLVFAASLGNSLYFKFFGGPLEWWIVKTHWGDLMDIRGSVGSLMDSIWVILALAFSALSIFLFKRPELSGYRKFLVPVILLLSVPLLRQAPVWVKLRIPHGSILAEQVLHLWWQETIEGKYRARDDLHLVSETGEIGKVSTPLAQFRDFDSKIPLKENYGDFPLLKEFIPKKAARLKEDFGFHKEKKINVLIIFLESVRAFEFYHPQFSKTILPRTHAILDRQGIVFKQAYSSAHRSALTVRGQLSALCSLLPNF